MAKHARALLTPIDDPLARHPPYPEVLDGVWACIAVDIKDLDEAHTAALIMIARATWFEDPIRTHSKQDTG